MVTTFIIGKICDVFAPTKLKSGQTVQIIRIEVAPPINKLGHKTEAINYYDLAIYGKDEINALWAQWNDNFPAPEVRAKCQIRGTIKNTSSGGTYNNVQLRTININFNYDSN